MIGLKDFTTPVDIKKESQKQKPKYSYFIVGAILLGVIIAVIFMNTNKDQEMTVLTPYQFMKEIVNQIDTQDNSLVDDKFNNSFTLFDTETSQRYMNIEFYKNNLLANQRYKQLDEINGYIHELDDSQQFTEFLAHVQSPYFVSESYVDKNIVFIFDKNLDKDMKEKLHKIVSKLSKKYSVEQSYFSPLEIETLSVDILRERFFQFMQKVDDTLAIQMINHELKQSVIEKDIIYLKDITLFEEYYQRWNQYIEVLNSHSFDGSELEKQLQKELQEKVYTEGEYIVGKDILAGEYIAVSKNHPQTDEIYQQYSWPQDTIFYLSNDKKISVSKDILLYSLENSPKLNTEGYTSGVFQVGQHIAAGTYELKANSDYPCDYWIIEKTGMSDFIDRINNKYKSIHYNKVRNEQTRTITLKENQILFLMNGKLEKQ